MNTDLDGSAEQCRQGLVHIHAHTQTDILYNSKISEHKTSIKTCDIVKTKAYH